MTKEVPPPENPGQESSGRSLHGATQPNSSRLAASTGNGPRTPWLRWGGLLTAGLVMIALQWMALLGKPAVTRVRYSELFELAAEGQVQSISIEGQAVRGTLLAPHTLEGDPVTSFSSRLPIQGDPELLRLLRKQGVEIDIEDDEASAFGQVFGGLLPWLLLLGAWFWVSRRGQGAMGRGPLAGMLTSRTRRYVKEAQVGVRFDDVAGLLGPKRDLLEVTEFLKEPEQFRRLGGNVPRGVLLIGPPGTGKTLLARAVAGEVGVPFLSISGSEFIEMFVGVGASRVRALFDEAKKLAPSIVFIDEIDAVGRSRGAGLGGGNDEREQTLNQLLSELDGFTRNDLTVVIAATNRPDVLDSALLRPGRFDRQVVVDRPERAARRAILQVHTRSKLLSEQVDLDAIAANTPGFSGADLANLANEAALCATRRRASSIEAADFSSAYDRIVLGDVRETKLEPEEKRRVAVHECGHAVVAHFSEHAEPLQRVSIIPRGMALGVTQQSPGVDRHLLTRPELESRLAVLMGGYAAESTVLSSCSSGAEGDLKQATQLAFRMVAHFGMSERVGPVYYEHRSEHVFLGQAMGSDANTSGATVHIIEQEARALLVHALEQAKRVISLHRQALDALVGALLTSEILEKPKLEELLGPPNGPERLESA